MGDRESDNELSSGTLVAGRFRISRILGSGGMATVYEATDLATNGPIAIKLLRPAVAGHGEAIERLRREGEVLTALKHPAIVAIETFGKLDDGSLFLAMERLEGETLGARIRRLVTIAPEDLTKIVDATCAGLAAAHEKGVVHRDLKPENIFLCRVGDDEQVKLLDFGISKVYGSDKLTQTGQVLGTPRYMAPEQLSAERDLDGRVDVYALGVIMYEALTGQPPFLSSSPSDLIIAILQGKVAGLRGYRPDLSPAIEAVVARAMARAREARFATPKALRDAWRTAAPPRSVSTHVPTMVGDPSLDEPRPNMRTAPFGSIDVTGLPNAQPPAVPAGTFGGNPPPAMQSTASPVSTHRSVPPTGHGSQRLPHMLTRATPLVQQATSNPPSPHRPPTRYGRTLLFIGALLAGAASAAIVIAILRLVNGG